MSNIVQTYPNGEEITKQCIQDEPWYPDYQSMLEMRQADPVALYDEFLQDFKDVFEREPDPDERVRFKRWAIQIAKVQREFEKGEK